MLKESIFFLNEISSKHCKIGTLFLKKSIYLQFFCCSRCINFIYVKMLYVPVKLFMNIKNTFLSYFTIFLNFKCEVVNIETINLFIKIKKNVNTNCML